MRIIFFLLLFSGWASFGVSQEIRGLYVNKTEQLIGSPDKIDSLCHYIYAGRFNHLLFYSLYRIDFDDTLQVNQLRSLIRRLRTECGIRYIGAVQESYEHFEHIIHPYNMDPQTDSLERFNVYNMEFEFWSSSMTSGYYCDKYLRPVGFPCNEEGAFRYVEKSLKAMQTFKKDLPELTTEIYIGWVDPQYTEQLSGLADRVLTATYRSAGVNEIPEVYHFSGQRERLADLARGGDVTILPIFNGALGTPDDNLYYWLESGHTLCEPWKLYLEDFLAEPDTLITNHVTLGGYVWFKYFSLPDIPVILPDPGRIEGEQYPTVGDKNSYRIQSVAGADRYLWKRISSDQIVEYHDVDTTLTLQFTEPGKVTLVVQAFGCACESPADSLRIQVKDIGTHVDAWEINLPTTGSAAVWQTDDWQVITPPGTSGWIINFKRPVPLNTRILIISTTGEILFQHALPDGQTGRWLCHPGEVNQGIYLVLIRTPRWQTVKKIFILKK